MATAETVTIIKQASMPGEESIKLFEEVETELKKKLVHLRHEHDKHEPEYFAAISGLSDSDLVSFSSADLEKVMVANSSYGMHMFGKVRIPAMPDTGPAYVHFRIFLTGKDETPKFHAFHTEEKIAPTGGRKYRAIFTKEDKLEWFED